MNSLRKTDLKAIVISLIVFAVLQALMSTDSLDAFWQLNILLICINIILSVSLNLINGYAGQFSLGHAGFMAIGAYTGAVLSVNFHMPFIVSIIISFVTAAFIGCLIGLPTMRLRGDYLAIATLGLGEIIRIVIMNVNYVGGAAGFMGIPKYNNFAWTFFVMLFVLFFIKNYVNSSYGRACIAIRENEIAAEAMGVNTTKYKVMAFTIGAGFAGVAGMSVRTHLLYNSPIIIYIFSIIQLPYNGSYGWPWFYYRFYSRCVCIDHSISLIVQLA